MRDFCNDFAIPTKLTRSALIALSGYGSEDGIKFLAGVEPGNSGVARSDQFMPASFAVLGDGSPGHGYQPSAATGAPGHALGGARKWPAARCRENVPFEFRSQ